MRACLVLVLALLTISLRADVSAIYGKYSPTGAVKSQQPAITWKLTPTGGGKVSRVEMLINDEAVEAQFNARTNEVEHTPDQPLDEGLYTVVCRVTIDRAVTVRQDWSFEVLHASTDNRVRGSIAATYALSVTNSIRAELGLPGYTMDGKMSDAALAHTRYQAQNGVICHIEDPRKPGYTGKAPWDRTAKFGFEGLCFEGVCGNQSDPRKAVRLLFDAPYHRIPFLQPGSPRVGIGFESGILTMNYAVSDAEGAGLSPAPGQADVPTSWDGNESPSPLRIHGAGGPVGYPIVFGWFSPRLEGITIHSMRLSGPSGETVPAYVNTPENDSQLRFAGLIIPKAKLKANTRYTAEVRATTKAGVKINRTWSFTTGS